MNPADYEEYGYDANANRTSLRKRDGTELIYQYDALSRMTQKTVPASATGAAGYNVFYGYDNRGLQTFARFGSASGPGVTNLWDGFGRLASSATNMDGVSRALSSQYDADGNRTALTGDQGYSAAFSYDGLGRMKAYADVVQFGYDSAGRRSSLAMGPGWASSTVGYGYDPAGRLQTLSHELGGTGADQVLGFAYNPASQIHSRSGSNDAYASNTAYNVVRPYSVNGLNQYTAAGPAAFAYDANGNLTSDGLSGFVYDSENRLVAASGAKIAALAYDPLGRLWQVSSGAATTRFLYDGDRLAMEYNGAGAVTRSYVHGPGADEPLVWYDAASGWARRFYHADHQGSIVALADDHGNALGINAYDAWGIPNSGNMGRFQYTGQAWLAELGMYYYKARLYSPTLGRFMQTDPIGYEDDFNLYLYTHNDPLNRVDPTGEGDIYVNAPRCPAFVCTPAQDWERTKEIARQVPKIVGRVGTIIQLILLTSGDTCDSCDDPDVHKPETLIGASAEEAEKAVEEAGFEEVGPTKTLGGTQYRKPGNPSDLIRIMPGAPNRSQEIKRGPYIEISIHGTHTTIPLKGNPIIK